MEFFKSDVNIDFMGMRSYTRAISLLFCLLGVVIIAYKGLNYGLDFTGGTQVEMRFAQPVTTELVGEIFIDNNFTDVRVQHYGTNSDIIVRFNADSLGDDKLYRKIISIFSERQMTLEIRRIDFVGAEVGEELAEKGGLAIVVAIIATMIYIAFRFEYRFAFSAAAALLHDIIIVLAVFSWFQIEFDLSSLAATLAILGYSLNDTIVVFDRVRENFRKIRKGTTVEIMNISLNQTLSRTIMTSWLTLLVVMALLFFGGESLFGFSLTLFIGIIVGTYSSVYVAGALAISFGLSRQDLIPVAKTSSS